MTMDKNTIKAIRELDMDFWCNAKRDIIILLFDNGCIPNISEIQRSLCLSYASVHKHINDLKDEGIICHSKESGYFLDESMI